MAFSRSTASLMSALWPGSTSAMLNFLSLLASNSSSTELTSATSASRPSEGPGRATASL